MHKHEKKNLQRKQFLSKDFFAQLRNQFDFGCYWDWKSIGFIGENRNHVVQNVGNCVNRK